MKTLSKIFLSVILILPLLFFFSFFNRYNKHADSNGEEGIIIQNYYYAKPGKEEEVLQWRMHACDVLKEIGVKPGRVLKCVHMKFDDVTPRDEPDVIWTVEYPDTATLNKASRLVESSGKFEPVMKHMETLTRDFNRIVSFVQK